MTKAEWLFVANHGETWGEPDARWLISCNTPGPTRGITRLGVIVLDLEVAGERSQPGKGVSDIGSALSVAVQDSVEVHDLKSKRDLFYASFNTSGGPKKTGGGGDGVVGDARGRGVPAARDSFYIQMGWKIICLNAHHKRHKSIVLLLGPSDHFAPRRWGRGPNDWRDPIVMSSR